MQPEDIDQLFRDRLAGHTPAPPDHLWTQLQQEIQPAKKRPTMWLYAAAAAVALLLVVGGGWLLRPGASSSSAPLATTRPARVTAPAVRPAPTSPTPPKSAEPQATAPAELASTPSNAPVQELKTLARRTPAQTAPVGSSRSERLVARQTVPPSANAAPTASRAATLPPTRPERLAVAAPVVELPRTLAAAPAPTGPIVVEVRREAPASTLAAAEVPADRPRRSRLGAVLRQAHNVVSGQPVDLHQVGLPGALTVQARVGSHTLTKTLEL